MPQRRTATQRSRPGGTQIRDPRIARPRVVHGGWRNVGTDHRLGARCEQRTAVALAAGDVEHLEVRDEWGGEVVTVPVLVPDLAGSTGNETLASEFEFVVHCPQFYARRPNVRTMRQLPCGADSVPGPPSDGAQPHPAEARATVAGEGPVR